MASSAAPMPTQGKSVREGADRIREIGKSAAAHAGNAAAHLRRAASEREQSKQRS